MHNNNPRYGRSNNEEYYDLYLIYEEIYSDMTEDRDELEHYVLCFGYEYQHYFFKKGDGLGYGCGYDAAW